MSAAPSPFPFPELPIPAYPYCQTPPAFHTHLGRRLTYTAYLIVGYVMAKSHQENMNAAAPASGRVWISSYELMAVTGRRERMVENGIEEAGPVRQNAKGQDVGKNFLEVETDAKRGAGWWFRALPANFTANPPNPPRKTPKRAPRTARMDVSLPLAALYPPAQPIAQQGAQNPGQPIAAAGTTAFAQPIAAQPIALAHPYNRQTPGEEAQPIALGNRLPSETSGTGLPVGTQPDGPQDATQCTGTPLCPYWFRQHHTTTQLASGPHPDAQAEHERLAQRIAELQSQGICRDLGPCTPRTAYNLLLAARQSLPGENEVIAFLARNWTSGKWNTWGGPVHTVREDLVPWLLRTGWPHTEPTWKRKPVGAAESPQEDFGFQGDIEEEASKWWDEIKTLVAEVIPPQAYQNWLLRTKGYRVENDYLTVLVPDQVTEDFLEQEYAGEIISAITKLDLPVKGVKYYRTRGRPS